MSIKRRLVTGIATTAILLNTLTPMVFADTTLTISGNGADSDNEIEVKTTQSVQVQQSNDADVHNFVNADASTGGNEADRNTGGDVKIDTGNANSTVNVGNTLNSNSADVDCNTCGGDVTAKISGNGEDSDNEIELGGWKSENGVSILQTNDADVHNYVNADAKTGGNEAERNTGGKVTINTGNAKSDVTVSTVANANSATVGGSSDGSSIEAIISGNGADSDNEIERDPRNSISIWQANDADVHNRVYADAKTGYNEAERNTGGDVKIDTGDATAKVKVNNKVNFNYADADCCELSITAKISGNGEDSDNEIEAKNLSSEIVIAQGGWTKVGHKWLKLGNDADLHNYVGADAKTGKNEVEKTTGVPDDPDEIWTGNAISDVTVTNTANKNVFGADPEWEMPDFSGINLELNFSLGDLLGFLGFHLG